MAFSVDSAGNVVSRDAFGGAIDFGVNGYHNWRHTVLGIDYRGGVRHYNRLSYYDNTEHTLSLGVTHELSRKWALTLRQAAGTRSRSYGLYSGYAYFDPAFASVPADELFNSPVYYLSSLGDLTYPPLPRLSFNMGGTGLAARRRSKALAGVTGYSARGDMQYRVNRRVSLGADYQYTHYGYTRSFGNSEVHVAAANLAFELGRYWTFAVRAGGARVETLGLQRVAVDPIIAAIIGTASGLEVFYRKSYVPAGGAKLSRAFRRSTIALTADAGVSPGNGIYLTSRQQSAGIGYSYTGFRRLHLGVSAGYSKYASIGQALGRYESYNGGGGFTYRLVESLHLTARYDARRQEVSSTAYRRLGHQVALGIAFSPGDIPLSLW